MTVSGKRDEGSPRGGSNGKSDQREAQAGPALDRVIQAQIGDKLRAMYGELAEQPVPDRLMAILSRINTPSEGSSS